MFWGRGSEPPDLTPSTTTCYAPRMKTSHGRCGRSWTQHGNRTSHCAACHETYANLSLFDAHRPGAWTGRVCSVPSGLVQDAEGVWWTLEGLANRDSLVERGRALADTRSAT